MKNFLVLGLLGSIFMVQAGDTPERRTKERVE